MKLGQFLSLQTPLLVSLAGRGHLVVLAFGIERGWLHPGRLVALTLPPEGGQSRWLPADRLHYPAPLREGPVQAGKVTRLPR